MTRQEFATDRRGQAGASLVLVMGLMVFLGALVPAILGIATTGLLVTRPILDDRSETYAASSGIDAAVALGRREPDIGTPGGPCPPDGAGSRDLLDVTIDELDVKVRCNGYRYLDNGCVYLDRFVTYTAEVRAPGSTEVLARASSEVTYRYRSGGEPVVEVRQFTPNAAGSVTTTTLGPCATTTTTQPAPQPQGAAIVSWGATSSAWLGNGNAKKEWVAEVEVVVKDTNGVPVPNALVTLELQVLSQLGGTWVSRGALLAVSTNSAGEVPIPSPSLEAPGNGKGSQVVAARFEVKSVAADGHPWVPPAAPITSPTILPPT